MHRQRPGHRQLQLRRHLVRHRRRQHLRPPASTPRPPLPLTATITATSTQDPSKSGTASITVQTAPPPPPTVPQSHHVVLVMEENQSYSTVVGATGWPNLNALIAHGALPTNYYADSHPSIGNYFMLTTGQLLTTDDNSTQVFDVDNIARRMLSAGVTFRVYAEGITQGYTGGNTGLYLIRHNPFAMLSDVASNPAGREPGPLALLAVRHRPRQQRAARLLLHRAERRRRRARRHTATGRHLAPDQHRRRALRERRLSVRRRRPAHRRLRRSRSIPTPPTAAATSPRSSGDPTSSPATRRPQRRCISTRACSAPSWKLWACPIRPAPPPMPPP